MSAAAEPVLRCERLVIGHRRTPILPPCDLQISRPGFVLIVGRNGSGKTTLLRTMLGLLPPIAGRVSRARPDVRVVYVAQSAGLDRTLPLRARDIVGWGTLVGWSFLRPRAGRRTRQICDEALAAAGASELADRPFRTLSEGQKQRVLLARMLAAAPDVAFLDEPTAAMDVVAEEQTMEMLAQVARQRNMAVVVISHVIGLGARFADQIVFLDRDDGVVLAGRPGEVFAAPSFRRQFGAMEVPGGA